MDWYEDLILIANDSLVACLFSDGSFSSGAFSLPNEMTISAIRSGPTGILIGANMGNRGAIILWDGNALRSRVPWKWVTGNILSIEPYGENWLVKTDRQVLITNGITIKEFFGIFDDPLTFNPYSSALVLPQQMAFVNDVLLFTITNSFGDVSQFGKKKPGLYLYFMTRKSWCYIPVPTGDTIDITVNAVYFDIQMNRIVLSYSTATANYLAAVVNQAPTSAQFISEEVGLGRIKYQRVYFGPTDKTLEGVILNLGILNSITESTPLSFNVSLKVYNFRRQLWGHAKTSAALLFPGQIQIDGTQTGSYDAQVAALRQLTGSLLVTSSILGLARLAGAGVDANPVSTNFGKVKLGNTTLDMTGGNAAYARLVSRLITGKEKSSTGKVTTLGAPIMKTTKTGKLSKTPFTAPTRADEALTYLRSHLSPIAGAIANWMAGTNVIGQPVTLKSEAYNALTPLVLQDFINMYKNDPKNTAAILPSLSAIFGVSMQSTAPKPPKVTKKK